MQRSFALAALLVNCVVAEQKWYFRGTPNDWAANQLEKRSVPTGSIYIGDGQFCHTEMFAKNGDEFKISSSDSNWNEAYPSGNWVIQEGTGVYDICFDEDSKKITVEKKENFRGPYLRSTKNNFGTSSPMTLKSIVYGRVVPVSYVRIEDFEAGVEFKVSETADWKDGSHPENNYVVKEAGRYAVRYYSQPTKKVVVEKL